jgi:hypothetical protein
MRIMATQALGTVVISCIAAALMAMVTAQTIPVSLKVLKLGLGSGIVTGGGINCGNDCTAEIAGGNVTLTAMEETGSSFVEWGGDCVVSGLMCTVSMDQARAVTAKFNWTAQPTAISRPTRTNTITGVTTQDAFTPEALRAYLTLNSQVNTPARFIAILPAEFRQNWILMSRSESLQTGTAQSPRILLPSADAKATFTIGMTTISSYPGAHPNAIEYMQWDEDAKNFRFHEIVLGPIPAVPPPSVIPERNRGVEADDRKCSACHSTNNVKNDSLFAGTSVPGGAVVKNKPNWDAYDSWAGMLPFNRDKIYQDSKEAEAFRRLFNLWNWRNTPGNPGNDNVRKILERLLPVDEPLVPLPQGIMVDRQKTTDNEHIKFNFDTLPSNTTPSPPIAYDFGDSIGNAMAAPIPRDGNHVTLRHTTNLNGTNGGDEGRGVKYFDLLGGARGNLNQQRIVDELIKQSQSSGIDVRPIVLAIAKPNCLTLNGNVANRVINAEGVPFTGNLDYFNQRNRNPRPGITTPALKDIAGDTSERSKSLPKRKADVQKLNLDRRNDPYLFPADTVNGLFFPDPSTPATPVPTTAIRQEVFRRSPSLALGFTPDQVIGGVYVDREDYGNNTDRVALFRYFLEPLGVSVDKWSMGVRGRSRTYTFADVFDDPNSYIELFISELTKSLELTYGVGQASSCAQVLNLVNRTIASLPAANAFPKYTDVQRILNKSCIECHNDLGYPANIYPSSPTSPVLNFTENGRAVGESPMLRPFGEAMSRVAAGADALGNSSLHRFLLKTDEQCPARMTGMMPCGGPPLNNADINTIGRFIEGDQMYSEGDPHIRTINNVNYDFQSAGEFVLARDLGMEIQVRQTAVPTERPLPPDPYTGLSSCVSLNTAAGVRVGPHRITYQPVADGKTKKRVLELRIDGKPVNLGVGEIRLPSGGRVFRAAADSSLQIDAPGGTVINITSNFWDQQQLWYLNINLLRSRATEGIMGKVAPKNWLPALPDGTELGPRPSSLAGRYDVLYRKFEDAWRVTPKNSVFDYAPGTSTKSFTVKNWPAWKPGNCDAPAVEGYTPQPAQMGLGRADAALVCGKIADKVRQNNCIADVMATGNKDFATTYVETERKEVNQFPVPPKLQFPADRATIPQPFEFIFGTGSDKESKAVTYKQCIWPVERLYTFNDCDAKPFTLKPNKLGLLSRSLTSLQSGEELKSGKSYFWKVFVEDGQGGLSDSETRRFVIK